jgi:hypothetical protein
MRSVAVALAVLLSPATAAASIFVVNDASRPALRVDSKGNAEVSWTAAGARHTLLVPVRGRVLPGGRIKGADKSQAASDPVVAFQRALRLGEDGRFYALQAWRVLPNGPVELHFSRWKGDPTTVRMTTAQTTLGVRVAGRATFDGRGVPRTSPTPEGKVVRQFAYLDSLVGGRWHRVGGTVTRTNGLFRRLVSGGDVGKRYRVLVVGPNVGTTYAPDAASVANAP